jgi:Domain of unknown function (DUF4124)
MKQSRCLFLIIFSLLSLSAKAQWAWTDEQGRLIFSDRALASSVPDKRILKRPAPVKANLTQDAPSGTAAETASTAKPVASTPQIAGMDKELAERKKKTEQTQVEQRKLEEDRIKKMKADNCERARMDQKTLDSGVRITHTNAQGEREILDDAGRAAEAKRIQSIVVSDCS